MIYCTRSRFSATHANTVGKLYANFLANAKSLQGMPLLGCRCFARHLAHTLGGCVAHEQRWCLSVVLVCRSFIAGNKKGLESQGLSSNLWCPGETRTKSYRLRHVWVVVLCGF